MVSRNYLLCFKACKQLCRGYWAYGLEYPNRDMVQCFCGTKDEYEKLNTPNVPSDNCHQVYGGHLSIQIFTDRKYFLV